MPPLPLVSLAVLTALAQPPAACDSAALRTPVATVVDTLRLVARPGGGATALPRPWIDFLLPEIATRVELPRPLLLRVYGETRRLGAHDVVTPTMANEVRLRVRRDGHVDEAVLVTRSLADDADAALLRAIRVADSADVLPSLPDDAAARSTFFLSLGTRQAPDTVRPPLDRASVAVTALALPLLGDARPVTPQPGNTGPRYPEEEKARGREGDVWVGFVIDERGAPVLSTLQLLRFTSEPFVRAVYDALKPMRFVPATIGGCPVMQLVRTPFQFRLTR